VQTPLVETTHSTMTAPCTRACIAAVVYLGVARRISTGDVTPLPIR